MSIQENLKWIFIVTALQKIIGFLLTQALIRISSPDIIGKAAVQLELFLSTLLFLSREGIKLALLRENVKSDDIKKQYLVNLSWLPTFFISFVIIIQLILRSTHSMFSQYDTNIFLMYSIGALFESSGEPWVNMNLQFYNLKPKLTAEAIAIIMKSLVTLICILHFQQDVSSFGIAQISYGVTYLSALIAFSNFKEFLAIRTVDVSTEASTKWHFSQFIQLHSLILAGITTLSSVLKHILTESDKIALSLLSNSYNQGIFAVASNYGSLAARIIFLPVEETSRITFAKLALSIEESQSSNEVQLQHSLIIELKSMLQNLFVLIVFIGLIFIVFGIPYVQLFVDIVLSKQWRQPEMISTLRFFCFHLLILGINGISEGFVHSVAKRNNFTFVNIGYIASSVVFFVSVLILMKYCSMDSSGIVLANSLSMGVRICFSLIFISKYFDQSYSSEQSPSSEKPDVSKAIEHIKFGVSDILPDRNVIILTVLCSAVVQFSAVYYAKSSLTSVACLSNEFCRLNYKSALLHIVVGGIVFIAFVCGYYISLSDSNRHLVNSTVSRVIKRKKTNEDHHSMDKID